MQTATGLSTLGWSSDFEDELEGHRPARVAIAFGDRCTIATPSEIDALAPRGLNRRPVVGDWVAYEILDDGTPVVRSVLSRRSYLSRKVAGRVTLEQVIAANVDLVFVMTSINSDLNLRRIERYLATVWESGAEPIALLTKADLCEPPALEAALDLVAGSAPGIEVVPTSVVTGLGMARISEILAGADGEVRTGVLVGSSGVGKSSLINVLVGRELMAVKEIRDDDKGRHTTTHRQLISLPDGGLLIDTPGMRELQMWESETGLERAFPDIEKLAEGCRFRDCSHETEPGCEVRTALATGELERPRLDSYRKLQRELDHVARKHDRRLAAEEQRRWKSIHREHRSRAKDRARREGGRS